MDRIINVKVGGNHISKDNKTAGVRGEANVTKLRLTFDEGWNGFAKKITFWDARGLNPVVIDLLPHLEESEGIYLVPIPAEPMEEAGMLTFVIDGTVDDKVQRSISDKLEVKDAPIEKNAGQPVPPTKNELTQLAEEIEKINSNILEVRNAKEDTQKSAESADEDAKIAENAMNSAKECAEKAQEYSKIAQNTVGKTSYIGENGNWYAWDEEESDFYDTGIRAQAGSTVYCGDNPPDNADVWINPEDNDTHISIDTEMSDTSENPVQNKVVKEYVDDKFEEMETNFQTKESKAVSDYSVAIGYKNIAGAKGYYIKSIDMVNKKIYLSDVKVEATVSIDDNTDMLFKTPEYNAGDELTILANTNLGEQHLINCTKIVSISNNVIEYSINLPFSTLEPSEEGDIFPVVFCINKADVGSVIVSTAAYAEGVTNISVGWGSHAEGRGTKAVARYAHSEGRATMSGYAAHSEGLATESLGKYSHAEGLYSCAYGEGAHAQNKTTTAYGNYSHSEGSETFASGTNQHVQGRFNIIDVDADGNPLNTYADIVGNGKSDDSRSNAYTLDWTGNGCFAGDVYVKGADMSTGEKLATEKYVNDIVGGINNPDINNPAKAYTTYGISIDLSNSNPETAVTYTDDAVGMVAGPTDWYKKSIFEDIKPCLFKDGAVVGYLNPDNFAQFEDGTAADITSGDGGDVMIEIPKTGYKITKSGNTLTVQITDDPNKDDFCYKAHTRTNEGDREKLYIGAFLGSNKGDKLRSISGVSPLANTRLIDFRNYAKANGVGYDLFAFYSLTLLQCLYLIMYKNLDSQASIGMGYIGGYTNMHSTKNTGATFDKGMSYGTSDRMEQMKFLGIEDFWGNLHQWIDGLVSDKNGNALVATDSFNDTGDGYTNAGMVSTSIGGHMKAPQGTNDLGFIIGTVGGSTSTYFSDGASFGGGYAPIFGGCFGDTDDAGIFRLRVFADSTYGNRFVGGRLMFL